MKVEPGNILKLFLNFSNFEPQYSCRHYSYKKKECTLICYAIEIVDFANKINAGTLNLYHCYLT